MPSVSTVTMIKMLETLPEQLHDRVLEHMREYVEDLREEARWTESFSKTQRKLAAAARQVRIPVKSATHSIRSRPLIPLEAGRPFR